MKKVTVFIFMFMPMLMAHAQLSSTVLLTVHNHTDETLSVSVNDPKHNTVKYLTIPSNTAVDVDKITMNSTGNVTQLTRAYVHRYVAVNKTSGPIKAACAYYFRMEFMRINHDIFNSGGGLATRQMTKRCTDQTEHIQFHGEYQGHPLPVLTRYRFNVTNQ